MEVTMRVALLVLWTLIPIAAANAAEGDRFKCHVSDFKTISINVRREDPAIAARKNFEITILKSSIQVATEVGSEKLDIEIPIIGETNTAILGAKAYGEFINTISVSKWPGPQYEMRYPVTLTMQTAEYVTVWLLVCSKSRLN
jgi:hypothetical protein